MSSRLKALNVLRHAINKEHGAGTIAMASAQRVKSDEKRLPTGSLAFDFSLGGGLPAGRLAIFRGPESSGKTTTLLRIMGLAQGLCANCFRPVEISEVVEHVDDATGEVSYVAVANCDCVEAGVWDPVQLKGEPDRDFKARVKLLRENSYEEFRVSYLDVEGKLDFGWATKLGVDMRRVLYGRPVSAEETIDMYDSLLRTGSVDLMAIDSVGQMVVGDEVEKSSDDDNKPGLLARKVNEMARKVGGAVNQVYRDYGRLVTQVWINQEYQKIGISFGDNTEMRGGQQQKNAASVIVKWWSSKWGKEILDEDLKKEWQIGGSSDVRMNYRIDKNHTFRARMTGSYTQVIAGERIGQVDETAYVLAQAERHGLLGKTQDEKAWFMGDETFKTKSSMLARAEDPAVWAVLRSECLRRMLEAAS